jgi:hypothetical protein
VHDHHAELGKLGAGAQNGLISIDETLEVLLGVQAVGLGSMKSPGKMLSCLVLGLLASFGSCFVTMKESKSCTTTCDSFS